MAYIQGFGSYLPRHVVTNAELATRLGCKPEWIEDMSGIRERRYAADEENVISMGAAAGRQCLERCGPIAFAVDMVIVASGTSERRFPGPAAAVAAELGLKGVPALDVPIASAGSLFAMAVACQFAGSAGNVLVIAAEKMSDVKFGDPVEKGVAILFGDGAGACLVSRVAGPIRILDSALHSDGNFAQDLRLEYSGGVIMNGRSVIMQAARKIPAVILEVLAKQGMLAAGVSMFLMHQANQNLIDRVARSLGVESGRFYTNIAQYGNTSSASLLIAADQWWATARPPVGAHIVFAAFGAGFHWAAMLAEVTT